ncbi:DUF397 domain-containing protein [Sphaerisporangium sp. NPDC005288]|uniref:DUF397 domain-containing protein n=1 Tax=Sphaerisporangium sp. NPDC005288 TaxID=3155114 RepID=UPI0033B70FE0
MDLSSAKWRKSSRSSGDGGQCVEVASNLPGVIAVRDSKNPGGPVLVVSPREWQLFLRGTETQEV